MPLKKHIFLFPVIFFYFLPAATCMAQNRNQPLADSSSIPIYQANPVIINATRPAQPLLQIPYAAESIDTGNIQKGQKLISLEETLQTIPGIFVNNRNNFALGDRISIRGIGARASFGVRGIKIILDEIPLTMPDGQSQLNNLDLGSAGKIEIIKGPAASIYGNAAGGLINIQTENIDGKNLTVTPRILFGSDRLTDIQGKVSVADKKTNYLVNINKLKGDGFRENSAFEQWSVNAVSRFKFSDKMKITAVLNFFYAPYAFNPSSLSRQDALDNPTKSRYYVKQQGACEQTQQAQSGITFFYSPSQKEHIKLTFYGLSRSIKNPIPSRIIDLARIAGGIRMALTKQSNFGPLVLNWTGGLDTEFQFDKRKESQNNGLNTEWVGKIHNEDVFKKIEDGPVLLKQDEQVWGIGPFLKIEIPVTPQWRLTFGSRFDTYQFKVKDRFLADSSDDSGNRIMKQMSPMTGIVYLYSPTHSVYFNYSTAFQTPTTSELGNQPSGKGGLNPNLNPEIIYNYETGFKGIFSIMKLQYQLSLFHMHFTDMLIPYQAVSSDEVFFRNAGSAVNNGIELSLDWQLTQFFNFQITYTYMDFKFTDYKTENPVSNGSEIINLKGNKIPGVSPQIFYSAVRFNYPSHIFTVLQLKANGKYFVNDFNGPSPGETLPVKNYINDAFITLDLHSGKTWSFKYFNLQAFAGIDNIFNKNYNNSVVPNASGANFFEPAPGRTWYGGIKLEF